MFSRIMIPLDGSSLAEQVIPLAKSIATRLDASVVLFQTIEPVHEIVRVEGELIYVDQQLKILQSDALAYLGKVRAEFQNAGNRVEVETRIGAPSTAILEFAESERFDMIAMTTHGRTGVQRWVYGSVADRLLTGGTTPVLLVRASTKPATPTQIKRILVPLDGSDLAGQALSSARELAKAFGAEIFLFRAWDKIHDPGDHAAFEQAGKYLAETAADLQRENIRARGKIEPGVAAEEILRAACDDEADLVVMSTHGRSGISRWVMGSVADRVLRASGKPVLLIRSKPPGA